MHAYIRDNLKTLARTLGGPFRSHTHQRHHRAIDSYVRFIDTLMVYIEHLENQMSKISDSLDKATAEKEAWKNYANGLQPQVDAANAAAAAQAAQKDAEDRLAAIPIIPDAGDLAKVDEVLNAPADMPPTTPPADDTGGTPTPPAPETPATPQ